MGRKRVDTSNAMDPARARHDGSGNNDDEGEAVIVVLIVSPVSSFSFWCCWFGFLGLVVAVAPFGLSFPSCSSSSALTAQK